MTLALLLGLLFFMANVGGYHFAPLAHGAVIFPAMFTIAASALAAVVLGERVTAYRIAGIAIIVAGLATISGPAILTLNGQVALGDLMFVVGRLLDQSG